MKKALLLGCQLPEDQAEDIEDSLSELEALTKTLDFEILGKRLLKRKQADARTFLGKGKLDELKSFLHLNDIKFLFIDRELTPVQNRNLERILEVKVADRAEIILEIFEAHAKTKIAKTQVEIARLRFILPRLTKHWTHLERQKGGIGLKGVGEKQLELDRRLIKERIVKLKKSLESIDKGCKVRRESRRGIFKIALVGYTNSGKSTLLTALTEAPTLIMDRLFSTLDSKTRLMDFDSGPKVLITDTVGFIKNIPLSLIASFKSTLDEISDADILLIVVDLSHKFFKNQLETTLKVLQEINCQDKEKLFVFNKADLIPETGDNPFLHSIYQPNIIISCKEGKNIEPLKELIFNLLLKRLSEVRLHIPYGKSKLINKLKTETYVRELKYENEFAFVHFFAPEEYIRKFESSLRK